MPQCGCCSCTQSHRCFLHAQAPETGAIKGTIFDPSSAAIQGAHVTVVSDATGASRTTSTDTSGSFMFSLLTPGPYSVLCAQRGFSEGAVKNINVVVSETSVVDVHLSVATVGTSVNVASSVELAQTESSTLGRAVDQETINRAAALQSQLHADPFAIARGGC